MTFAIAPQYTLFEDDLQGIASQANVGWEELRGGRVFVTGGTGFFGRWLVESFLKANETRNLQAEMVVLSRQPSQFLAKAPHLANRTGIHFHAGDVRDFEFPAGSFSHVIHAATEASATLNENSPQVMFDTIVTGTQRVLDFSVRCGAKKFLLTSSGAVYGKQPAEITHVSEEYPGGPDPLGAASAYGEGKRVAEMLCAVAHRQSGLDIRIARCFAFVGPYLPLDLHFAIGNFLRDALQEKPIQIRGDGRTYRSYLYAADLVAWLWAILFRGASCRAYNVGSDQAVSILETAQAAAALVKTPLNVSVAEAGNPAIPAPRYVPSVQRAKSELGLEVTTSFEAALAKTFQWYKAQENSPLRGV